MSDDPSNVEQSGVRRRPSVDHPLNAAPRRSRTPAMAVLGLISAVVLLFLFLTWVRYNT